MITVLPPDGTPYKVSCKRFYHDIHLVSECPVCGVVVENDNDDYFSYPTINGENAVRFYHEADDGASHEWEEVVVLRLVAEVVVREDTTSE